MKRVGLNKKMVGIISALLIVIIALIALSSYRDASTILRNQINSYITVKTDYYAQKIISYFEKRDVLLTRETDHVSELISETNGTSSLGQYLASQLNKMKDTYGIVDIYMGYPDGSVVCGTGWVPEDSTWKANERSWYIAAVKNSGNIAYTDVYTDADTKEPVVTIAKAIQDGSGNIIGVVGMDMGLAQLDSLLSSEKLGDTGYPFVLDKDGRFLVHPKYDFQDDVTKADTIYNISNGSLKKVGEKLLSGKSEILRGNFSGVEKVYYSKLIDGTNFYLVSSITYQEMTKELDTMLLHNVIIAIIAIIFAVVALTIYLSKTTNAIKRNVNLLTKLSKGELNLQENDKDIKRKDEIGDILRATVQLKTSLVAIISGVNDTALSVLGACEHLEQVAQETVVTTDGIDKAVEDMASGATSMADITEDAARHTMTMAEDIEEIDHTVQMLLKNTEEMNVTNEMAMKTLEALNATNEKTKTEIEAIYRQTNETNIFARNINEAANFITAVANETNLLSLNASIEAARAGETGRGFMIVAEQIKKLAEQSHVSAKKIEDSISQLIQGSNNAVNTMHGVKEVVEQQNEKLKETQESFRASYDGFNNSVKNIDQIAKDAKNLNEARNNIVDIITNLSAISEENAASTQETSASTTVLTTAVNDVGSEVSVLRQLAEKMVQSISAFKLD